MLPSFLVARRAKFFSVSFQFLPSDFFRSCSDVVVVGGGDQRTRRASERGRGGQREREHEHVGVVEGANEQQCRRGRPSFPLSFAVGRLRAAVDVEPALLLPPSSPSSSSSLVRLSVDNCSPLSDTIFVERARRAGGLACAGRRARSTTRLRGFSRAGTTAAAVAAKRGLPAAPLADQGREGEEFL